jgi:hypothetical protein
VEKVLVRCCPIMENVRCTIHGSRETIAGTSVHTQGITFDCQEGSGDLQASKPNSERETYSTSRPTTRPRIQRQ